MEEKYCVYKHTCPEGKIYIGITNNIDRRWNSCGMDYEHCTNFFYAIRKYGWINISHEVLIENLSKEEAEFLEKQYIEKYNSTNPRKGYNMTTGGSDFQKTSKRRIVQYDETGNIINTYTSQIEAARCSGVGQTIISRICLHKQRTSKDGFVFRYEGDPFDINNCDTQQLCIPILQLDYDKNIMNEFSCIADAARTLKCHQSSIKSALDKNNRKCCEYYWCTKDNFNNFNPCEVNKNRRSYHRVKQFDLNGNYITTYKSMREAGDAIGINHSNISLVCKGERDQAGGYKWEYDDAICNPCAKRVHQIDINTKKIINTFNSMAEMSKETGINSSHISSVCKGKRKTAGGYIWRYADSDDTTYSVEESAQAQYIDIK